MSPEAPAPSLDPRRQLPSVEQALQRKDLLQLVARHGRPLVLAALRETLSELRRLARTQDVAPALQTLAERVEGRLERQSQPSLRRVVNATGVVVHTNLGRAPLSRAAAARVAEVAGSYCNLEYDLERGERGSRETHAEARLRALLGVEAVVVVNNCAAALLLCVDTLADGREVLVSRGELVEIGGSFRIPDVLRKGGARLREVGTTNRTRLSDYRAGLSADTAMILKVHRSNFRIVGFTEEATLQELAQLADEAGVPLVEDEGSGALDTLPGPLAAEPTVRRALDAAHVVTFSGDKLLGGPQAGLVVGRAALLDRMRRNPLYRALRVDKMTLAALDATLLEHAAGRAATQVPVLRMLHETSDVLSARAAAFAAGLGQAAPELRPMVIEIESAAGGGAAPELGLVTPAVAVDPGPGGATRFAARLRAGSPPVVARVVEDRIVVDLRTVVPEEEQLLLDVLTKAARQR